MTGFLSPKLIAGQELSTLASAIAAASSSASSAATSASTALLAASSVSKDTLDGVVGISEGKINITNYYGTSLSKLYTFAITSRNWEFPDYDGTIAMMADIAFAMTGNAGSATTLQTPRLINGVGFDGSTDITINAVDSTARIASSEKGVANGVPLLDAGGVVPISQLPSYLEITTNKDASDGYVGLTQFKINFKDASNTYTSFLTNANTAPRAYTFPDYSGTMSTLAGVEALSNKTITSSSFSGSVVASTISMQNQASTTPTYGAELVTNGDFASTTGWTLGAGWAITGGQAVLTANTGSLSTDIAVTSGVKYQVSWTEVSGTAAWFITAGTVPQVRTDSTSATFIANYTGTITLAIKPDVSRTCTIDNFSVKQVLSAGRATPFSIKDASGLDAFTPVVFTLSYSNTAIGLNAMLNNTTGYWNTAYGSGILYNNTTGYNNTVVGTNALFYNTTGNANTAFGAQSCYSNTTGYNNTAIGINALLSNTTGYNSVAIGSSALQNSTLGIQNVAVGVNAMILTTTANNNTAVGSFALNGNTVGASNSAFGTLALADVKPTSKAITTFADYSATVAGTVKATSVAHGLTGSSTKTISGTVNYQGARAITVIDVDSFYFTATWVATETGWWGVSAEGTNNTAIGNNTGRGIVTGAGNTILGANVTGLAAGLTDNIILATGTAGAIKAQFDGANWNLVSTRFSAGLAATPTRSTAATGSTITLTSSTSGLLYDQAATIASLTITLPSSSIVDGQTISISTRSEITALTVNGGTIYGAPTTLLAGGFATFIYSSAGAAWFRKG